MGDVMKQHKFNEMIVAIVCFLGLVPLVCATPTLLLEDFDDGNGIGAFDPSFAHTLGPGPNNGTGVLDWEFNGESIGNSFLYVGLDTQDYITFLLDPGQYVSHASVSYVPFGGSISFIGQYGSEVLDLPYSYIDYIWSTAEADMSTIGLIQGFAISGGAFDDIRITVVPEPSTWLLFLAGTAAILGMRNHRALKSINTTE